LFSKATQLAIQGRHELFIGLASQDLSNNEYGYVTEFGKVTDIDTSDYEAGDILWFDSAGITAGALTDVEPAAPLVKIQVAAVIRSHQNEGVLFVRPTWYHELGELHDVKITTVADKDLLVWNSTSSYWENSKTIDTLSANTLTASTLAGTLSTAAQTNVTSVGTLSSLVVSGNLTVDTNTLYVDTINDRVGIGEDSPDNKLHVNSGTTNIVAKFESTDGTGGIALVDSTGNVELTTSGTNGFNIQPAGGSAVFRVDGDGKVGIKETSPLGDLHIKSQDTGVTSVSTEGSNLVLEGTENGMSILSSTAGAGYINFGDSDDNNVGMIIYGHSSNSMDFWTNAQKRMMIDSSGNVEIGATAKLTGYPTSFRTLSIQTPSGDNASILELVGNRNAGDGNQNGMIQFWNKTSTAVETARISGDQTSATNSGMITFLTASSGVLNERMRIDSNGNVGINGSSVSFGNYRYLTINGNSTTQGGVLYLRTSDASHTGEIYVDSSGFHVSGNNANQKMFLKTVGTTRVTIDSSGAVGIGATSVPNFLTVSTNLGGSPANLSELEPYATVKIKGRVDRDNILYIGAKDALTGMLLQSGTTSTAHDLLLNPFGGNILIGQTADLTSQRLQVNGFIDVTSSTGALRFYDGSTYKGGIGTGDWAWSGVSANDFGIVAPNNMIIGAGSTPNLYLISDGDIGVGISDPATKLDVNGNGLFRVGGSATNTGDFTIANDNCSRTVGLWSFSSTPIFLINSENTDTPHIGLNMSVDYAAGPKIIGYKSRGSAANNVSVNNGDEILSIEAWPLHTSGPNQYKFGGGMTWYKNDGGGTANTYAPVSLKWVMSNSTTSIINAMELTYDGQLTKTYQYGFAVYNSANIDLTSTDAKLALDSESYDIGGVYDQSNRRFTAPRSGRYLFTFTASVSQLGGGQYNAVYIQVNGNGTTHRFRAPGNRTSSEWGGINGSAILDLAASDYVELWGYTASGSIRLQAYESKWCGYFLG